MTPGSTSTSLPCTIIFLFFVLVVLADASVVVPSPAKNASSYSSPQATNASTTTTAAKPTIVIPEQHHDNRPPPAVAATPVGSNSTSPSTSMSNSSSSFSISDSPSNPTAPVVDFASRALTSLAKLCNRVMAFTASAFDSFSQSYDDDELDQHKSIVQLFNDLLDAVEPGVTVTINHNTSSSLSPNTTRTMGGIDVDMNNHIIKPVSVSEIVPDPTGNQTITTIQHLNVSITHNKRIGDGSDERHPDINYSNVSSSHYFNSDSTQNSSNSSLEQTSHPVDHNLNIVISNVTVVSSTSGKNPDGNMSTSKTDKHNVTVADIGVVRQSLSDVNTTPTGLGVDLTDDTILSSSAASVTHKTLATVMSEAMSTIANDSSVVIKQHSALADPEKANNMSSQTTGTLENMDKVMTVTEIMNQTGSFPCTNNDSIQSQQDNSLIIDAAIQKELRDIANIMTTNDTLKSVFVSETNATEIHTNKSIQTELANNHMGPIDHPHESNASVETQENRDDGNKTMNVGVSVVPSTLNQHVNDTATGTITINTTASEPQTLNNHSVNQTNVTVVLDMNKIDSNKTVDVAISFVSEKESEGLMNSTEPLKGVNDDTIIESQAKVNVSESTLIAEAITNQTATNEAPNVTLSAPVVLKAENGSVINAEANPTQTQSMLERTKTMDNRTGLEHLDIGNLTSVDMPNITESQPNPSTTQQKTTNISTNQTQTVVENIGAMGNQTESALKSQPIASTTQQETTDKPINQIRDVIDHIKATGNQTESTAQQEITDMPTNQTQTIVGHIEATGNQKESILTSQPAASMAHQETKEMLTNETQTVVDHIEVTRNQTRLMLPSYENHINTSNASTTAAPNTNDLSLVPNSTVRSAVLNSEDVFGGDDGEEDEGEVDPESPPSTSPATLTSNHQFNLNPMRPLETQSPSHPSMPIDDNYAQGHDHSDGNRPSATLHTGEMDDQVQTQSPMQQQYAQGQEKQAQAHAELPRHAERQTYVMRPLEPRTNTLGNDQQDQSGQHSQQTQQDNVPRHDDMHHPPLQHRQMSKESIDRKPERTDPRYDQAREYARNFERLHLHNDNVHPDEVNSNAMGQGPLNGPQNQVYEHPQGPQDEARVDEHDDAAGRSGHQNVNDQSHFSQQYNHEHGQEQSIRDRSMDAFNGAQNQAYDQPHVAQNDARVHEHDQYPTRENVSADYPAQQNANDQSYFTHQDNHEHAQQSYHDRNTDKYMGDMANKVEGNSVPETGHSNKVEGQTEAIHEKLQYTVEENGPNTPTVGTVKDIERPGTNDESSTNEGHSLGENRGDNITQLAMMVYKIARAEQVNSIAAVPCQPVKLWMPGVLRKLHAWNPSLEFFCVDTSDNPEDRLHDLREAFALFPKSVFIKTTVTELNEKMPRGVDLVLSWMGIQQWGVRNGWKFFKSLKRSGAKLCLLSNNAVRRNPDDTVPAAILNVRKPPLLFKEPSRLIKKVNHRDDSLQMLLYDMNKLRDDF